MEKKNAKNKSKKKSKTILNENLAKSLEESRSIGLKTYQGYSFERQRNKFEIRERRRLQRLQKGKEIINNINNITKKLSKKESLFITEFNEETKKENQSDIFKNHIPRIKLQSNVRILKEYNVFETEDDLIKRIMYKLSINENEKKLSKTQKKRMALDKIYGYSPNLTQSMKEAKKKKFLPLEEYQNNMLNTFANNYKSIDQGQFIDLIQNMKDLRLESESVSPLPKINIKMIKNHFLAKGVKNLKQMSIKDYLKKEKEPMDEFERENLLIMKMKSKKLTNLPLRNKRNKNLDNLPTYLRELFNTQIKYHG
jgi:hypothetical protein